MYLYFEGYGGIEPHIHDLQSKRRSICNISLILAILIYIYMCIIYIFIYFLYKNIYKY